MNHYEMKYYEMNYYEMNYYEMKYSKMNYYEVKILCESVSSAAIATDSLGWPPKKEIERTGLIPLDAPNFSPTLQKNLVNK